MSDTTQHASFNREQPDETVEHNPIWIDAKGRVTMDDTHDDGKRDETTPVTRDQRMRDVMRDNQRRVERPAARALELDAGLMAFLMRTYQLQMVRRGQQEDEDCG